MRLFGSRDCGCEDSGLAPLKFAVISALFVVIGDFIALILAIVAIQQYQQEQEDNRKQLEQQISVLQKNLEELKCRM